MTGCAVRNLLVAILLGNIDVSSVFFITFPNKGQRMSVVGFNFETNSKNPEIGPDFNLS